MAEMGEFIYTMEGEMFNELDLYEHGVLREC